MNISTRLLATLLFISLPAVAATEKQVPYTEYAVAQFVIASDGSTKLPVGMPTAFSNATKSSCAAVEEPEANAAPVAPLVAALGGIVVDWLFTRTMNKMKEKLKEEIKKHSVSYSNPSRFTDMLGHESKRWDSLGQSCVVFQRYECNADAADVKSNTASCGADKKAAFSVGVKLRKEGNLIRVLPYGAELTALKPKHAGGDVAVVSTARVEAIAWNAADAGSLWTSPEVKLASIKCAVSKPAKGSSIRTYNGCFEQYLVTDKAWERAQVLPMPPLTVQAMVFTVGEVGEPSSGLKGFAEFLDAAGDSMSGALSAAFQKKIGLTEE